MVNRGEVVIDTDQRADPQRHGLERLLPARPRAEPLSTAFHASFKKRFSKTADGKFAGVTSDSDGRINAATRSRRSRSPNARARSNPGKYILLRYIDPQWRGFYDIFKVINDDLLIGRVYLGDYPRTAFASSPSRCRARTGWTI